VRIFEIDPSTTAHNVIGPFNRLDMMNQLTMKSMCNGGIELWGG
jgi:hypothetical protein